MNKLKKAELLARQDKINKFAIKMSKLLFEMRSEDSFCSQLQTESGDEVPEEFLNKTLDDKKHIKIMKSKIAMNIITHLTTNPNDFIGDDGEYHYTSELYDFSYYVDTYIENLYMEMYVKKHLWLCDNCNSDNVQMKAWVNPNNGNAFISDVEDNQSFWCDDCCGHYSTTQTEMKYTSKVEGFQVNLNDKDEMHPDMEGSFCLYNLTQVNKMIDPDPNEWSLLTIWTDDVEEPTYMFEGNPRD